MRSEPPGSGPAVARRYASTATRSCTSASSRDTGTGRDRHGDGCCHCPSSAYRSVTSARARSRVRRRPVSSASAVSRTPAAYGTPSAPG
ncbi:hypothetical protein SIN09_15285, partial [Streptomyces sp. F8]|uniref:hypothetical protein n=1 Tax=Streptomyces sp. F8 TaxID=1436085 RepID=UPI0029D1F648